MPGAQRGARPGRRQSSRGDATGRVSEEMRAEQAAEIQEAAKHTTLLQPPPTVLDGDGDDETDFTPEGVEERSRQAIDVDEAETITPVGQGGPVIKAFPRENRRSFRSSGVGDGEPYEMVTVRMNGNYPDVTLGNAGATFDFEEGRRYQVERWVAQHFDEKDMLASFG